MLLLSSIFAGCGEQEKAQVTETREISPIIDQDGADPFVTTYGDKYLYTKTTGGNVCIAVADSIQNLGAAELKSVYEPGSKLTDLWAPEIWNLDDCWYIYFAATIPGEEIHRMFVLRNESVDPMEGEWQITMLQGMDNRFAIDGTIMELDGKRYFIWSGWEGNTNVRQDIYLAEMENPWQVKEEKILLSMPELAWEKHGDPLINEGPEVVVRDKTVNLVYSASGSWTDDYCLGLLTMEVGKDPKNPDNWTKDKEPILSKAGDVYGPGHNSFTKTVDGSQDMIIYHAARWEGAGWTRGVRFGYVDYDENGKILPMEVTSGAATLAVPESENGVTRYNSGCFKLYGEIKPKGKDHISGFEYFDDYVTLEVKSDEEKDVTLVVFARPDGKDNGVVTNMTVSVNDKDVTRDLCCGENYQPLFFPVHLVEGKNQVVLSSDMGGTTINVLQVEVR